MCVRSHSFLALVDSCVRWRVVRASIGRVVVATLLMLLLLLLPLCRYAPYSPLFALAVNINCGPIIRCDVINLCTLIS